MAKPNPFAGKKAPPFSGGKGKAPPFGAKAGKGMSAPVAAEKPSFFKKGGKVK